MLFWKCLKIPDADFLGIRELHVLLQTFNFLCRLQAVEGDTKKYVGEVMIQEMQWWWKTRPFHLDLGKLNRKADVFHHALLYSTEN